MIKSNYFVSVLLRRTEENNNINRFLIFESIQLFCEWLENFKNKDEYEIQYYYEDKDSNFVSEFIENENLPKVRKQMQETYIKNSNWTQNREMGFFYGYRKCCVDYFCSYERQKRLEDHFIDPSIKIDSHEIPTDGTGLITCPECSEKLINQEMSFENYFQDRKSPYTFPKGR